MALASEKSHDRLAGHSPTQILLLLEETESRFGCCASLPVLVDGSLVGQRGGDRRRRHRRPQKTLAKELQVVQGKSGVEKDRSKGKSWGISQR